MNKKGDIDRYILWFIILLALLFLAIYIYYTSAWKLVESILIKELVK